MENTQKKLCQTGLSFDWSHELPHVKQVCYTALRFCTLRYNLNYNLPITDPGSLNANSNLIMGSREHMAQPQNSFAHDKSYLLQPQDQPKAIVQWPEYLSGVWSCVVRIPVENPDIVTVVWLYSVSLFRYQKIISKWVNPYRIILQYIYIYGAGVAQSV
jgi:hypothetical protein